MKTEINGCRIELYNEDCLALKSALDARQVAAVVTDPPYGSDNNCDYTRFSGGLAPSRNHHRGVYGDDKPFDPTPWLEYDKVILWGYQHFAQHLPVGTVLVWLKKRDSQFATILSDAELAWQKGGKGVYVFRHIWNGFDRETERGQKTLHPTQKPIALMRWCVERITEPGDTVLDPYMGSGATCIACIMTGRHFIGAEISEQYFRIAEKRIADAQAQLRIPVVPMSESDDNSRKGVQDYQDLPPNL